MPHVEPISPALTPPRTARRTRALITPAILFVALIAGAGCGSSDAVDCQQLARHETRLLTEMLPADMQSRASRDMAAQTEAIEARCERDTPSEAVARCQLAASDIRDHRHCTNRGQE